MNQSQYTGNSTDFYLASPAVAKVVNLAVALRRPILVEGEPGCGKTQLAYSIAAEMNGERELKLERVVKISVKSTSRAQDLLYRVNALKRLQDAQNRDNPQAPFLYPYLSLGPLGKVIQSRQRCVVLLDEIDKADIDFPNDLLDVLDRFEFQIEDLPAEEEEDCRQSQGFGRTVRGDREHPPIVVITSNREKRLPEPFLRRCLYVQVKFPEDSQDLRDIVRKNTRLPEGEILENLINAAIAAFLRVRKLSEGSTHKPPTSSELIDWVQILNWEGITPETLEAAGHRPPLWDTLFKVATDLDSYDRLSKARETPASPP
ncbi:MAG: MoxR family ATPase [Methylococcaceae bacterium]|nr:MoxR family ATPase [Methylococcaceae bacterium]